MAGSAFATYWVNEMTDLRERFASLDRLEVPDLWQEATLRANYAPGESRGWAGLVLPVAVAATIAAAAFLGLAQPWRSPIGPRPSATPTATAATSHCVPPRIIEEPSDGPSPEPWNILEATIPMYPPGRYWWDPDRGYPPMNNFGFHAEAAAVDFRTGAPGSWDDAPRPGARETTLAGCPALLEEEVAAGGALTELWHVNVDGTPLIITTWIDGDATPAQADEARAIVQSLSIEPWESERGFRILFTMTAGWDSK